MMSLVSTSDFSRMSARVNLNACHQSSGFCSTPTHLTYCRPYSIVEHATSSPSRVKTDVFMLDVPMSAPKRYFTSRPFLTPVEASLQLVRHAIDYVVLHILIQSHEKRAVSSHAYCEISVVLGILLSVAERFRVDRIELDVPSI